MSRLDGIFVYDIDDLQSVVSTNLASRRREAERAQQIIEEELDRFTRRIKTREVAPTIVSLQEHLETIRQAEVDRARGRLGKLTPQQEDAIEALTRGIVNKVLHSPITTLKHAAGHPQSTTVVEIIQRIFNLNLNVNRHQEAGAEAAVESEEDAASPAKRSPR